jgi:hypothetical protein
MPNKGAVETLIIAIFLLLVLYGFEALSLTLEEERRLKVYENRVLKRMCNLTEELL